MHCDITGTSILNYRPFFLSVFSLQHAMFVRGFLGNKDAFKYPIYKLIGLKDIFFPKGCFKSKKDLITKMTNLVVCIQKDTEEILKKLNKI